MRWWSGVAEAAKVSGRRESLVRISSFSKTSSNRSKPLAAVDSLHKLLFEINNPSPKSDVRLDIQCLILGVRLKPGTPLCLAHTGDWPTSITQREYCADSEGIHGKMWP